VDAITEDDTVLTMVMTFGASKMWYVQVKCRACAQTQLAWLMRTGRKPSLRKQCRSFCAMIKLLCILRVTVRVPYHYKECKEGLYAMFDSYDAMAPPTLVGH
jgi:hypothetical protein